MKFGMYIAALCGLLGLNSIIMHMLFSITALFVFVHVLILFACLYVITIIPLIRIKIIIIIITDLGSRGS